MGRNLMFDSNSFLIERLRRRPCSYSVPGSLPVVAFGDCKSARVATIGLNPSDKEYVDKSGIELNGSRRRFESLGSLGCEDRAQLTDEQCLIALDTMRDYFMPDKPVYAWFRPLGRVLDSLGSPYQTGEAAHLDLVQEATSLTWSNLHAVDPNAIKSLLQQDLPFLQEQLARFHFEILLCNGRTVFDEVRRLVNGEVSETLTFGSKGQLKVYRAHCRFPRGKVSLLGWNMPLARAGLTKEQDGELGKLLLRLSE